MVMKIGFDIDGGDYDQIYNILALVDILPRLPKDVKIVLIGDNYTTINEFKDNFEFFYTKTSIETGIHLLEQKKIDAFISTGDTGEVIKNTTIILGNGKRLCLPTILPNPLNVPTLLLDIGANIGCSPNTLNHFATLGNDYMKSNFGIDEPKIGLLNVGTEDYKGTNILKQTHRLLSENKNINFIGNIDGYNLYDGSCDVIVCDGLVGNVIIKQLEALSKTVKIPYMCNASVGAQLLGIDETVIIGHGSSSVDAIQQMVLNLIK